MKLAKTLKFTFALLMGVGLTSCGAKMNTLSDIKSKGELVVATNATFQPFEYLENGEFKGIDIAVANAYADSIGAKLTVSDIDFDAIVPSIKTYKADIGIAGMTKTDARAKIVDFTDTYYEASQVVIVKKDSSLASYTTSESLLSALEGKKIGCQKGTTGQYYIEGDEEMEFSGIKNAICKQYTDGVLATKDLNNGNIDAVIIDSAPASLYVKQYPDCQVVPNITLTNEEYAIAVAKDNTDLLNSLNSFIKDIKANGKLAEIINAYYAA